MAGRYGDKAGWLKKKKAGKPWTTEFCVVRGDVFEIYPDDDIGERTSKRGRQAGRQGASAMRAVSCRCGSSCLLSGLRGSSCLACGSRLLPIRLWCIWSIRTLL